MDKYGSGILYFFYRKIYISDYMAFSHEVIIPVVQPASLQYGEAR